MIVVKEKVNSQNNQLTLIIEMSMLALHSFFYIRTSNFGAEAECSNIFFAI